MTHTTAWDEISVLDYFWQASRDPDVDRLSLLKQIADVRLARPSDWDRRAVRAEMLMLKPMWLASESRTQRITLRADACWVCLNGEHRIYWHHVITVQHGGSSTPRNLVPLCHRCHRVVHPFMPTPTTLENVHGWTALGDFAGRAMGKLLNVWEQHAPVPSQWTARAKVTDDGYQDYEP